MEHSGAIMDNASRLIAVTLDVMGIDHAGMAVMRLDVVSYHPS